MSKPCQNLCLNSQLRALVLSDHTRASQRPSLAERIAKSERSDELFTTRSGQKSDEEPDILDLRA